MQTLSLLLATMVVLGGCKLHRENTAQDKFGRAASKISKQLAGEIDDAVKKFTKDGNSDDIAMLIKKGGKTGNEAMAAFQRIFTRKKTAVNNSIRILEQHIELLRNKHAGKNIDYEKLLQPWFDDARVALDEMLETAEKYYKALPKVTDSNIIMKKLYVSMDTDYLLKTKISKISDIKSSAGLAERLRKLEILTQDAYAAAMKKVYNMPVENYFLARWWTEVAKLTKTTDNKQLMKMFDNMMAKNPSKASEFYLSFTKNNVEEIEKIIYRRIPNAANVHKVDYHLDELIHELNTMKVNIKARNNTLSKVLSQNNAKALRETHEKYLLKISDAGKRLGNTNAEVMKGRVFGVWGDDIFETVADWERRHGKILDSVEDVEVRDMLYDLQELCKMVNC